MYVAIDKHIKLISAKNECVLCHNNAFEKIHQFMVLPANGISSVLFGCAPTESKPLSPKSP